MALHLGLAGDVVELGSAATTWGYFSALPPPVTAAFRSLAKFLGRLARNAREPNSVATARVVPLPALLGVAFRCFHVTRQHPTGYNLPLPGDS